MERKEDPENPAVRGLFYGWRVVAASFFVQFATAGTTFYAYGVLLKPLSEDLGTSRFAVSAGLSLLTLVGSSMAPWIGRAVDGRGARGLMLAGAVLMSTGFFLFSRIESVLGLYLTFGGLVAAGAALLGPITNTALVAAWFRRTRGVALGISQIGVSLSGMVMAYVATWLVATQGWRGAVLSFSVIPILLVAPVVALVVVNRPADRGLLPDGDRGDDVPLRSTPVPRASGTLWRALRERDLWFLAVLIGLNFTASGSVIGVIHSHTTDLGHSAARAAGALSLLAGMASVGKPIFGSLSDRTSARLAMATNMGLQAIGLAAILFAPSYLAILAGVFVFGLGCGGLIPLFGLLTVDRFGTDRLGEMMGAIMLVMLPLQLSGLPFATAIFDRTGSYSGAFMAFLGFYAIAGIVLKLIPSDRRALESV